MTGPDATAGSPSGEAELIARAKRGDEDAFAELVLAHSERVMAALRRFGLAPLEVEEVTQEVFLRAWRALGRFEQRAAFSTWLYRIAFNESRRLIARTRAEPGPVGQPSAPGRDDLLERVPAPPAGEPAARALDREFEVVLQKALLELPADCRVAVVLRDLEGLSTREAADVIGVGLAAFKSRLHRGRMQLRVPLAAYLGRASP